MKHWLMIVALVCFGSPARAGYIKTILEDPAHPRLSVGLTFDSKMELNGGVTMAAIVFHPADPSDSLIPQRLLDLGMRPVGWALNAGVGGTRENVVVPLGLSANLTPTVLGPVLDLMKASSSKVLVGIARAVDGPDGGVAVGPQWTAHPISGGVVQPLNRWRFPPGWFVGALWRFQ